MVGGVRLVLRWLGRIALGLVALVVLTIAVGSAYELYARHQVLERYPPTGRLVDIGGRRIHLDCRGRGAPTVVFEAGLGTMGVIAWSSVQDQVASFTRACSYDRAGLMWSDPTDRKVQDADAVADDLHATLAKAGERGPIVLVGHSIGGPYVMDYARKYGDQVAGLVFVDASHPDQFKRYAAAGFPTSTKLPAAVHVMADTTWMGWTRIPHKEPSPPSKIPPWLMKQSGAFTSTSMSAAIKEADAVDATEEEAGRLRTLGDRPLVVLTGMKPFPEDALKALKATRAQGDRYQAMWKQMHDEEASWSTRSRHQVVPDASHFIQFDRPDVVIAAVKEIVGQVRADQAKSKTSK